jgi:hypothetical protein
MGDYLEILIDEIAIRIRIRIRIATSQKVGVFVYHSVEDLTEHADS